MVRRSTAAAEGNEYVEAQPLPAEPVVVQQEIVVGSRCPRRVVVTPIRTTRAMPTPVVNE